MAVLLSGAVKSQAFRHRSARVIALSRTVLVSFFALAVWLDPTSPAATSDLTFLLLFGYTLFSGLVLCATWASWWLEARVASWAHIIDLAVFTILVFLTEGYVSPFFTFFVFLVLSAAIRVGWREALFTTALVLLLFLAASLVAANTIDAPDFQLRRFMIRGANLFVLSLMIVWFGVNQSALRGRIVPGPLDELPSDTSPIAAVMSYAASILGAGRIVFAWSEAEEPWLNVWSLKGEALTREKFGPDEFADLVDHEFGRQPFLFDCPRRRVISVPGDRVRLSAGAAINSSFRDRFDIDTGLSIPVSGVRYDGQLFALEVPGLSADDLRIAGSVGKQVGETLDRRALLEATENAAAARTRMMLARDLHDSVVQAFAGISLKLQGLRNAGLDEKVDDEMKQLLDQLAQEQRDLRGMIAKLRDPEGGSDAKPLPDSLAGLAARLEQQWRIRCPLTIAPDLRSGVAPQHDIDQLVREAVANAVRHGEAGTVEIAAGMADGGLRLCIADDGKGFPIQGEFDDRALGEQRLGPRSLHERVHSLGGTMRLATHSGRGSTLTIMLPDREARA